MKLIVHIEPGRKLELETQKTNAVVGRTQNCDFVIPHDSISRAHCRIEMQNGIFFITDLGSSNGTFIDGHRVGLNEKISFLPSSRLALGKLDCTLSESVSMTYEKSTKDFKSSINKNAKEAMANTQTRRFEVAESKGHAGSMSLKKGGTRNPVSEGMDDSDYSRPVEYKSSKRFYVYMFIILSLVQLFMIGLGIK